MHEHRWKEDALHPRSGSGVESFFNCPCCGTKYVQIDGDERLEKIIADRIPMDIMNCDRAAFAQVAVDTFAQRTGLGREDIEMKLSDLLCDMMHLADFEGLDWIDDVFGRANMHYEEEIKDEKRITGDDSD